MAFAPGPRRIALTAFDEAGAILASDESNGEGLRGLRVEGSGITRLVIEGEVRCTLVEVCRMARTPRGIVGSLTAEPQV
ncbi:MAG: hypothetical protein AAGC57_21085 [Pseudomonadota bacterium]